MVAIEQSAAFSEAGRFHLPTPARLGADRHHCRRWSGIGGFAARGFSDNGLRLGSELVWRFTCFVYFAAIIAGPLARLIPSQSLRRICEQRRQI